MPKMTSIMPIYWKLLDKYKAFENNKMLLNDEKRNHAIKDLYKDIQDIEELFKTFKTPNREGKIQLKVRDGLKPIKIELKKLLEKEGDEFILEIFNREILVQVSFNNIFFSSVVIINYNIYQHLRN